MLKIRTNLLRLGTLVRASVTAERSTIAMSTTSCCNIRKHSSASSQVSVRSGVHLPTKLVLMTTSSSTHGRSTVIAYWLAIDTVGRYARYCISIYICVQLTCGTKYFEEAALDRYTSLHYCMTNIAGIRYTSTQEEAMSNRCYNDAEECTGENDEDECKTYRRAGKSEIKPSDKQNDDGKSNNKNQNDKYSCQKGYQSANKYFESCHD